MICYIEKIRARFRARFRALFRARFRARFRGPFRGYYRGPSLTDCRSWALRGASILQSWQESTLSRTSVAWKFMESSSCYVFVSTRPWPHFPCPQTPFAFRSSWNNLGLIGATLEPSVIKKCQSDLLHSYPCFGGCSVGILRPSFWALRFKCLLLEVRCVPFWNCITG